MKLPSHSRSIWQPSNVAVSGRKSTIFRHRPSTLRPIFRPRPCWRLRGALDVPKERFVSYPFCSRDADPSLLIGWAGWDHLQQAKALAAWYTEVTKQEGWSVERLKPLLAGLTEIIPWLKQWHNDLDPEFQERMGDFFETFLQGQLQRYGLTRDDLKHWTPPAAGRPRRGRRRSSMS